MKVPTVDSNAEGESSTHPQNEICPRCNRKLKSRGAFCETGSHWVHYFCDRLTEDDISRLHNDPGFIYRCKQCLASDDNTMVKTIANSDTKEASSSPKPETKTILQLPNILNSEPGEPKGRTAAEAILHEETSDMCHVCELPLDGNANRCDFCAASCHEGCMAHAAGMEEICLSCAATQAQIAHEAQLNDNDSRIQDTGLEKPSETSSTSDADQNRLIETQAAHIEMDPEGSQIQATNQPPQGTGPAKTAPTKPSKTRDKKYTADSLSVKQRELRQLEIKLKKWEEELKTQEAKMADMTTTAKKLENYLERTEARNVELERTVRTLQRKICVLEDSGGTPTMQGPKIPLDGSVNGIGGGLSQGLSSYPGWQSPLHHYGPPPYSDLISGIHQQVSRFVLNKVARQLNELEMADNLHMHHHQTYGQNYGHPMPTYPSGISSGQPNYGSGLSNSTFSHNGIPFPPPYVHNVHNEQTQGYPTPHTHLSEPSDDRKQAGPFGNQPTYLEQLEKYLQTDGQTQRASQVPIKQQGSTGKAPQDPIKKEHRRPMADNYRNENCTPMNGRHKSKHPEQKPQGTISRSPKDKPFTVEGQPVFFSQEHGAPAVTQNKMKTNQHFLWRGGPRRGKI